MSTIAKPERAPLYWIDEAVVYLGLDRLGLEVPQQAIRRMVRSGALKARKIRGRLAFTQADLDEVVQRGDQKRSRGRPRLRK